MMDIISLITGLIAGLIIGFFVYLIINIIKKKKETKTSLPTMKMKVLDSKNPLVDPSNNLLQLNEIFNKIEESK